MQKVGVITQLLSTQGFQLSPVRLTLSNYLTNLYSTEELFTADTVFSFLQDCMEYPHWQQHKSDLINELEKILRDLGEGEIVEPGDIADYLDRQILELANDRDFAEVVQAFLTHRLKGEARQFRLFADGPKRMVAVCLKTDSSLEVRQFDRKFTIRQGSLEPLRTDMGLHYDSNLDFDSRRFNKLEVAPYVLGRFRVEPGGLVRGKLVRGYIFQKFQDINSLPLESVPRLFLAVKRMEQFFIRRETDPFYQKLTNDLERMNHLAKIGEPLVPAEVMDLQLQVQNALEYVFTGDKLLTLLLKDMQNSLALAKGLNDEVAARRPHQAAALRLHEPTAPRSDELSGDSSQKDKAWTPPTRTGPRIGLDSINFSLKRGSTLVEPATASSKKAASPSTERKSTSSDPRSIPRPTKSSSMENP